MAGGDPGLTVMLTLLKALRGISLLSLLAKGASPLRTTPTLKPCVTRTGFRHLRARHRLTIPLRTVKSLPRFPAATGTPEARYCAQGFNVGPRLSGVSPYLTVQLLRLLIAQGLALDVVGGRI